jgi:hypothetical protein
MGNHIFYLAAVAHAVPAHITGSSPVSLGQNCLISKGALGHILFAQPE